MNHAHIEHKTPPKLAHGALRVVALGGIGEIGRNMTVFEYGGKLLIIDCGVSMSTIFGPVRTAISGPAWVRISCLT